METETEDLEANEVASDFSRDSGEGKVYRLKKKATKLVLKRS